MDLVKLMEDCIKNFDLDVNMLRDIAFSICIADKIHGTNNKELDVDKFVSSDSELDWDSVLSLIGVQSQNKGIDSLPRVQKLRVISDMLSLSVNNKVNGLCLMCKSSSIVATKLGVSLKCVDYADEAFCYENLEKIESYVSSVSIELGSLESIYNKICIYNKKILSMSSISLSNQISSFLIPSDIYKDLGKSCSNEEFKGVLERMNFTVDDYADYFLDSYCYELVQEIAKLVNIRFSKNEVEFNLILTRLNNFAGSYLPIGTYSLNGYTKRLSVLRNVPSYLSRKVNIVFSESSHFSEMTILGCISVLYLLNKINISKDYLISEMEGLLDEFR